MITVNLLANSIQKTYHIKTTHQQATINHLVMDEETEMDNVPRVHTVFDEQPS